MKQIQRNVFAQGCFASLFSSLFWFIFFLISSIAVIGCYKYDIVRDEEIDGNRCANIADGRTVTKTATILTRKIKLQRKTLIEKWAIKYWRQNVKLKLIDSLRLILIKIPQSNGSMSFCCMLNFLFTFFLFNVHYTFTNVQWYAKSLRVL